MQANKGVNAQYFAEKSSYCNEFEACFWCPFTFRLLNLCFLKFLPAHLQQT